MSDLINPSSGVSEDSVTGQPTPNKSTGGASHAIIKSIQSAIRHPTSSIEGYMVVSKETAPVILTSTSAKPVGNSLVANDAILSSIVILANATAVTAIVNGFLNDAGVATAITFTGSTTADTIIDLPDLKNNAGQLTVTASVTNKVLVGGRTA